ncbi:MAG: PepSY domain-containing protein [Chloroflexota bacterium]
MNTLRNAFLVLAIALLMALPAVAQQDGATTDDDTTFDLLSALEALRAEYGEDVVILEAELDMEDMDDEDDTADDESADSVCAEFEILLDGAEVEVEVCQDASTGDIVLELDQDDDDDVADDDMDDDDTSEITTSSPAISLDDAIATAQAIFPNATLTSIELDIEDGVLVWDIEFDDDLRSVDVDAESGNVLYFGYESEDDANSSSSSSNDSDSSSNVDNASSDTSSDSSSSSGDTYRDDDDYDYDDDDDYEDDDDDDDYEDDDDD